MVLWPGFYIRTVMIYGLLILLVCSLFSLHLLSHVSSRGYFRLSEIVKPPKLSIIELQCHVSSFLCINYIMLRSEVAWHSGESVNLLHCNRVDIKIKIQNVCSELRTGKSISWCHAIPRDIKLCSYLCLLLLRLQILSSTQQKTPWTLFDRDVCPSAWTTATGSMRTGHVSSGLLTLLCLFLAVDALSLIRARGRDIRASGTEMRRDRTQDDRTTNQRTWLNRVKRGWKWNQFSIQEEYTGTEYLYIGKVHAAAALSGWTL